MRLDQLLEIAGMTEDDLPATEEETHAEMNDAIMEVADVRQQLADERAGITSRSVNDHTWPYRARAAAKALQARVNALKRHLNTMKGYRQQAEAQARREEKAQRRRYQAEAEERALERRRIRATTHDKRMRSEAEVTLAAVRKHIQTLPEAEREAFYAVMREAQDKLRSQENAHEP